MQLKQLYGKMSNSELRQKYIDYWNECDRIQEEYEKWYLKECARISNEYRKGLLDSRMKLPVYPSPIAKTPPFPEELNGLT